MKTIQIAPHMNEIEVNGNQIHTNFAGGVTYTAEGLEKYKDEFLKDAFRQAIALCSKRWQIEELLNDFLHLDGKVS